MDPISHAVIGRAVAAAGALDRPRRRGTSAAAVLGALSPDIDFVLMPIGWDIYLRAHVIGTHAAAGAVVTGLGSAVLVWLCAGRGPFMPLARVAVPAALSHVAADVVTGARLHAGWPFVDAMTTLPLVAMNDPWTIAILFAGLVAMWRVRPQLARPARLLLLALGLFLGVKGVLLRQALHSASAGDVGVPPRVIEPVWGSLTKWTAIDRTPGEIRRWSIRAGDAAPALTFAIPLAPVSPLVGRSRELSTVRNFLAAHEMAFPTERTRGSTRIVLWSDARFCRGSGRTPRPDCALWFGGVFDEQGRPVMEEVHVGTWVQTRPVNASER